MAGCRPFLWGDAKCKPKEHIVTASRPATVRKPGKDTEPDAHDKPQSDYTLAKPHSRQASTQRRSAQQHNAAALDPNSLL